MSKYIQHFKTICTHKFIVFKECAACGIPWQGIKHDLSKFSFAEFISSARYFQGDKSPIEAQKAQNGYSAAWQHHKGHNPHHWEYWIDFSETGEIIANKIPFRYVVEMICDWIGAGKVYNKIAWTQHEPLAYYNKVRTGRYFHPETEKMILGFLTTIDKDGLSAFHKMAHCKGYWRYLKDFYRKGGF